MQSRIEIVIFRIKFCYFVLFYFFNFIVSHHLKFLPQREKISPIFITEKWKNIHPCVNHDLLYLPICVLSKKMSNRRFKFSTLNHVCLRNILLILSVCHPDSAQLLSVSTLCLLIFVFQINFAADKKYNSQKPCRKWNSV